MGDNGIFIVRAKCLQMLMFRRGAVRVLTILRYTGWSDVRGAVLLHGWCWQVILIVRRWRVWQYADERAG